MKKIIRAILIILGLFGIINTITLCFFTNFNLGFVVVFVIGSVLLTYGIWFDKINKTSEKGFLKWVRTFALIGLAFLPLTSLFLGIYSQFDNVTYNEDALIVLGCGVKGKTPSAALVYRLEKALEYHNKNKDALIVVSGGQGPQEDITEALAMERYLIENNVPPELIIREENSHSTSQNFIYSKEILDEYFLGRPYTAAFTTNNFHIYRAEYIARINNLPVTRIHAGLSGFNMPINYIRESCAVLIAWIFGI